MNDLETRPVHILVECPELIVSARLGVMEPLKPLESRGVCIVRFEATRYIKSEDIVWADILITVRGCETVTRNIVMAAKKAGRFIIYYLDDDLLNVPRESTAWSYYNAPELRNNLIEILGMSDVLWGVNPNIREKYLQYTANRWMQNRLPVEKKRIVRATNQKSEKTKVLYAGSTDHKTLVREIIAPVVERLSAEYGERVEFTFIGPDPGLPKRDNIKYIPFISPYEEYRKYVENGGFSIGLAPGRTDSFYACKYYNKFVEYSSIGAVGVYTDAEPYTQIVTNGENGVLCDNTPEKWYQSIKMLLDDPELRAHCTNNALKLLEQEFDADSNAEALLTQCPELGNYHAKELNRNEIKLRNDWITFYIGRTKIVWKSLGLRSLLMIPLKALKVIIVFCALTFNERVLKVFASYFKGIYKNRFILGSLVQRDLQMKYRRSKLGVAWTILTPLGLAVIVGTVYSILFGTSPRVLIPLIFAGINPWSFMSGTADGATMAFPAAEGYIKQSTVAPQVFPLRATLSNFVTLIYSVITFFGIYLLMEPNMFGPSMLMCIPGLMIMFFFTLGLANITSVVNIYIRDFAPFQGLIFQGLFYATPIIYDAQVMAEKGFSIIYEINPFYYMLEIVRRPMLGGGLPSIKVYMISGVIALVVFIAGIIIQEKARRFIPYML